MVVKYDLPDDLAAKVEEFKEKTGMSDTSFRKIVEGGELQARREFKKEGTLAEIMAEIYEDQPEKIRKNPDDYITEALHEAVETVVRDENIESIASIKKETGLSDQQMAKILEKASDFTPKLLQRFVDAIELVKNVKELDDDMHKLPFQKPARFTGMLAKELTAIGEHGDNQDVVGAVYDAFDKALSEQFTLDPHYQTLGEMLKQEGKETVRSPESMSFVERLDKERAEEKDKPREIE